MTPTNPDPNLLEDSLRNALRREDAPEGFAAGVLARVAQQNSPRHEVPTWLRIFSVPLVRWAAFAAISASLIVGTIYYRNLQRQRLEGEAAKQQLMLALRIAGSKLQLAKSKVNEINTSRPDAQPKKRNPRSRS
ncbi:MAG TPA: hypothetical protein VE377_21970 [Candidatus Dormibacteraeota bacterium]|nr:hypothetical protein [Candidatus Dormibacteraeota bacterium]